MKRTCDRGRSPEQKKLLTEISSALGKGVQEPKISRLPSRLMIQQARYAITTLAREGIPFERKKAAVEQLDGVIGELNFASILEAELKEHEAKGGPLDAHQKGALKMGLLHTYVEVLEAIACTPNVRAGSIVELGDQKFAGEWVDVQLKLNRVQRIALEKLQNEKVPE